MASNTTTVYTCDACGVSGPDVTLDLIKMGPLKASKDFYMSLYRLENRPKEIEKEICRPCKDGICRLLGWKK